MTESTDLIAGRYRLAAQIGVGGMGVVWRARDEVLGRTVAVKELTVPLELSQGTGDDDARRAMREARIAARLHHPNVIGIFDIVDHEKRPFLVMEYLASRSLSQLIADGELVPPKKAAGIGVKVAGALIAAHGAGIVHRDVKPGNVLLGDDGSVKLTDFGISRATGDTTVTASGILLGTLGYVAPETAQGHSADARSDVYALGATLYAAVEGHAPFGDDDNAVALMYRIVHEEIIPLQHAGHLEPVLLWMLQRDPALRPTMPEARRALEAIETASEDAAAESAETVPVPVPAAEAAPVAAESPSVASGPPTPPAGTEADGATSGAPERPQRRLSRRALIGVLIAAAVLLGLGGWALAALPGHGNAPSSGAGSSTHPSHAASSTPASVPLSPGRSPSSHPATATTSPSPSSSPKPPTSATATATGTNQDVAAQLVSTIENYYKLVPGDLKDAWTWMTPDYQTNHAGGRSGYDNFWSQVQSVSASSVVASPPNSVTATINYLYKNGSTVVERTQFGMVKQGDRWLIASSSVVSHQ